MLTDQQIRSTPFHLFTGDTGNWCSPLDRDAENDEEEGGHQSPAEDEPSVTAAADVGLTDPLAGGLRGRMRQEQGESLSKSHEILSFQ